jgi:Rod binding domain-containing protein
MTATSFALSSLSSAPSVLSMSADAASALTKADPKVTARVAKAKAAGEDFEAVFLHNMIQQMFKGVGDGPFSGGQGAQVWRSFLTDEYSKSIVKSGGIGIAAQVQRELLAQQEVR